MSKTHSPKTPSTKTALQNWARGQGSTEQLMTTLRAAAAKNPQLLCLPGQAR